MLRQAPIRVTTTGGAGVAAGSGFTDEPIVGEVLGVYLNFHASAPGATTDTTFRSKGSPGGAPSYTMLALTNTATDGYFAPRAKPVDNANAAITNAFAPYCVADYLEVAVAQCDALTDAVVATVFYDDKRG